MSDYSYVSGFKRKLSGKIQSITEHRKIWIEKNGEIPSEYILHHINGDGKDNRLENLKLVTRSEHTKLHPKGSKKNDRKNM